jgi:hypothetical protein
LAAEATHLCAYAEDMLAQTTSLRAEPKDMLA